MATSQVPITSQVPERILQEISIFAFSTFRLPNFLIESEMASTTRESICQLFVTILNRPADLTNLTTSENPSIGTGQSL